MYYMGPNNMALRRWTRRNKNELIVLTGSVYAFVSYLTAFTLEVLFLLDLARQNSESPNQDASSHTSNNNHSDAQILYPSLFTSSRNILADRTQQQQTLMDKFNFDYIQAHLAISCLAIAVLYFLLFIASLKLVVALILRSTFVILIWICLMTTMYLPEFGLVIYVSIYCWGLETRNGQTELIFYLFRALLNVLFIWSARKLFKEWSFEKTFLRLKSSTNGYDSPYFITGPDCRAANLAGFNRGASGAGNGGFLGGCRNDSLSTTINPLFTSSTLNLSSYDQMADCSPLGNYRYGYGYNYNYNDSNNNEHSPTTGEWSLGANNLWRLSAKGESSNAPGGASQRNLSPKTSYRNGGFVDHYSEVSMHQQQQQQQQRATRSSRLAKDESSGRLPAINIDIDDDVDDGDNLAGCELDIEYRTLSHRRRSINDNSDADASEKMSTSNNDNSKQSSQQQQQTHQSDHSNESYHRYQHQRDSNNNNDIEYNDVGDDDVAYDYGGTMTSSTQSLDRLRYLRSPLGNAYQHHQYHSNAHRPTSNVSSAIHNPEQVILRPLRHRPFDYLHRPGSSSNINNQ